MKSIRFHLTVFVTVLLLSGITAFPIRTEIAWLYRIRSAFPEAVQDWIVQLETEIAAAPDRLLYGTDWLAFGHIVIALFFIPVWQDPKGYRANVRIGLLACLLVLPLAFICGPIRGIPFFHQLIDCSFGLIGFAYLYFILRKIDRLKSPHA